MEPAGSKEVNLSAEKAAILPAAIARYQEVNRRKQELTMKVMTTNRTLIGRLNQGPVFRQAESDAIDNILKCFHNEVPKERLWRPNPQRGHDLVRYDHVAIEIFQLGEESNNL